MIYRNQTSEPVSLLPKTLRTFKQFLYQLGRDDYVNNIPDRWPTWNKDAKWIKPHERLSYLAGRSDIATGH